MRASRISKIIWILLVTLFSSAHHVYSISLESHDTTLWLSKVKYYKSPVQRRVADLQARRKAGYIDKKYGAKSVLPQAEASMHTMADCEKGFLCSDDPMPVTLISFKGSRIDPNHVTLTWETSSETNNEGFEIERSPDGLRNFTKIAFVDGAGNSNHTKSYTFTDLNADANITYYRLKQLDYDGSFEYSRIIAIQAFKEVFSVFVKPNPGNQQSMSFQLSGNKGSEADIEIYNTAGLLIYRGQSQKLTSNKLISLGKLPKLVFGLYVAKITSAGQQSTVSFIVTP